MAEGGTSSQPMMQMASLEQRPPHPAEISFLNAVNAFETLRFRLWHAEDERNQLRVSNNDLREAEAKQKAHTETLKLEIGNLRATVTDRERELKQIKAMQREVEHFKKFKSDFESAYLSRIDALESQNRDLRAAAIDWERKSEEIKFLARESPENRKLRANAMDWERKSEQPKALAHDPDHLECLSKVNSYERKLLDLRGENSTLKDDRVTLDRRLRDADAKLVEAQNAAKTAEDEGKRLSKELEGQEITTRNLRKRLEIIAKLKTELVKQDGRFAAMERQMLKGQNESGVAAQKQDMQALKDVSWLFGEEAMQQWKEHEAAMQQEAEAAEHEEPSSSPECGQPQEGTRLSSQSVKAHTALAGPVKEAVSDPTGRPQAPTGRLAATSTPSQQNCEAELIVSRPEVPLANPTSLHVTTTSATLPQTDKPTESAAKYSVNDNKSQPNSRKLSPGPRPRQASPDELGHDQPSQDLRRPQKRPREDEGKGSTNDWPPWNARKCTRFM
ncbi:hypothetical protein NU195Hw_g2533t1 [Hortaea werneckii]